MPYGPGPNRTSIRLLTVVGVAALVSAAPAHAGNKNNPAPIVFAGNGAAAPSQRATAQPSTPAPVAGAGGSAVVHDAPGGKRIEFRYPDQPSTYYSGQGARQAVNTDPMVFSSSKSAVAPEQARHYAAMTAPTHSVAAPSRDPSISAGGFDARAAAARVASKPAPVAAAPLKPIAPPAIASTAPTTFQPVAASTTAADETGIASWYGEAFHGNPTANGETFDMNDLTAAHPSLPLPSLVQVVNTANGRDVVVRVNDRGPFVDGRIIDLSKAAAAAIGMVEQGEAQVRVRYLGPAPAVLAQAAPPPAPKLAAFEDVDFDAPPPAQPTFEPSLPVADPITPSSVAYFVQLGSFADIGNAQALVSRLAADMPVDIVPARVSGADYFRVMVGPLSSRSTADTMRNRLARAGIADGIVVKP